jgi:phosphate transport system substrate-binding protein
MRRSLAIAFTVLLAAAPQAAPPAPAPSQGAAPAATGAAKPAAKPSAGARIEGQIAEELRTRAGGTGTDVAIAQGTDNLNGYTAEVSAEIKRFPEYLAKSPPFKGSLRIDGSTSMAGLLGALGRAYEAVYSDVKVEVKQGGSSKGLADLRSGACDMAAVSRQLSDDEVREIETATGLKVFQVPVALDAVCVYVNRANPLAAISREQLNGIFSITHSLVKDPVLRWSDLDPKSPLGDNFMPIYMLPASHGTMQEFMRWAMPDEALQTITRHEEFTPTAVVNACCAYRTAIGLAGYMNRQPRANMVPVRAATGQPAVAPSFRTIRDGSYPMWRPLNLVMLAKDEASVPPMLVDFLRFIWSESGQDTVATLKGVVVNLDRPPALIRDAVQRPYTAAPTPASAPAP